VTEPTEAKIETQGVPGVDARAPETVRAAATKVRPRATETRRLYAADWAGFTAWCRQHQQRPLPSPPETVAAYLASLSTSLVPGALARRAAAIADRHRSTDHLSPCADEGVRAVLRATRAAHRTAAAVTAGTEGRAVGRLAVGRSRVRAAHPSAFQRAGGTRSAGEAAQLARMAARCPGDLAGLRDRALLLLAAAGIGGDQLLALDREHVHLTDPQLALRLSGSEPEAGLVIPRHAAAATCPVRALDNWIRISDTRFGPLFRKVDRWGNVEPQRLRPDGLRRIWQRRVVPVRQSRAKAKAVAAP